MLEVSHTAHLRAATLAAARTLLDDAFDGGFDDHDWDHTLGGMHALLWHGGELAGHAALVQRRLLHAGRAWRVGYVEGVAVAAGHRRRGHAAELMTALEAISAAAYDFAALSASSMAVPLYAGRGWQRWTGPTAVLTPDGVRRTPDDDGGVYVLPQHTNVDLAGELICDWRDGDVW